MPRYKCKVDIATTYEFELNASSIEEAKQLASTSDISTMVGECTYYECTAEELPEIAALFTLPELPSNAPQDLKDAHAVFVKYINEAVANEESEPVKKETIRKQSDTTKITQKHYDNIMYWYQTYSNGLLSGIRDTSSLCIFINKQLGLNKSRSVYSKIWNGDVDRESLPKGE